MAKKKVNVRKDYSYEAKKSLPAYAKSKVARKSNFLLLHGPEVNLLGLNELNLRLKEFAKKKTIKIKILVATSESDLNLALKESNTWATGAILSLGTISPEAQALKLMLKKMLIPVKVVSQAATQDLESLEEAYLEAIKELSNR